MSRDESIGLVERELFLAHVEALERGDESEAAAIETAMDAISRLCRWDHTPPLRTEPADVETIEHTAEVVYNALGK